MLGYPIVLFGMIHSIMRVCPGEKRGYLINDSIECDCGEGSKFKCKDGFLYRWYTLFPQIHPLGALLAAALFSNLAMCSGKYSS